MAYDNTKLKRAMDAWLKAQIQTGKDYDQYARELLEAFVSFAREHKMLKGSPGPVAFGKELKRRGFTSIQKNSRSYWTGLRLDPELPPVEPWIPPRIRKQLAEAEAQRQLRAKLVEEDHLSDDARETRRRQVLEEMKRENADKIRNPEPDFLGD